MKDFLDGIEEVLPGPHLIRSIWIANLRIQVAGIATTSAIFNPLLFVTFWGCSQSTMEKPAGARKISMRFTLGSAFSRRTNHGSIFSVNLDLHLPLEVQREFPCLLIRDLEAGVEGIFQASDGVSLEPFLSLTDDVTSCIPLRNMRP
jgi:hypothetical protein